MRWTRQSKKVPARYRKRLRYRCPASRGPCSYIWRLARRQIAGSWGASSHDHVRCDATSSKGARLEVSGRHYYD
jgi:hypothetical protein